MNLRYILISTILIININKSFGVEVGYGETCDGVATTCATGYFCAPWGQAAPNNGNTCAKECTTADQDIQCGKGNLCESLTAGSTDTVCKSVLASLTSTPCTATTVCNADTEICNEFTLKCEPKPSTSTYPTTVSDSYSSTINDSLSKTTKQYGNNITPEPCVDLIIGGPNDCNALAPYCNNDIYKDLMKAKCPKTCGYCTPIGNVSGGGCRDINSDCYRKQYLCKNTIYRDLMKRECPMTCGYC